LAFGIKAIAPGASRDDGAIQGDLDGQSSVLYGTTYGGGAYGYGLIFKVDLSSKYTVLYSFTGYPDGVNPAGGVIADPAGNLYGATFGGGPAFAGVVYKLDPAGNYTVLHGFAGGADGGDPWSGVIRDGAGNLCGTTRDFGAYGYGVVYRLDPAGKYTVLHAFTGGLDGGSPYAGVIHDRAGNLYGTTAGGGSYLRGVVYKLDSTGKDTALYSFSGRADGEYPGSALVLDSAGNLYGTASGGAFGSGVVYKVDPAGKETVLHAFTGGADGANPSSSVVFDSAGNLYGTAEVGGVNGGGVLFKLDPAGKETVLHAFTRGADGNNPTGRLALDSFGNLFGTTAESTPGFGLVYKLDPKRELIVLHTFASGADGASPLAGVILRR
jgi:uncharacterized repeat protein (TIGR03803 family)